MKRSNSALLLLVDVLSGVVRVAVVAVPLLRPNAPKRNALLMLTYLLLGVLLFGSAFR